MSGTSEAKFERGWAWRWVGMCIRRQCKLDSDQRGLEPASTPQAAVEAALLDLEACDPLEGRSHLSFWHPELTPGKQVLTQQCRLLIWPVYRSQPRTVEMTSEQMVSGLQEKISSALRSAAGMPTHVAARTFVADLVHKTVREWEQQGGDAVAAGALPRWERENGTDETHEVRFVWGDSPQGYMVLDDEAWTRLDAVSLRYGIAPDASARRKGFVPSVSKLSLRQWWQRRNEELVRVAELFDFTQMDLYRIGAVLPCRLVFLDAGEQPDPIEHSLVVRALSTGWELSWHGHGAPFPLACVRRVVPFGRLTDALREAPLRIEGVAVYMELIHYG